MWTKSVQFCCKATEKILKIMNMFNFACLFKLSCFIKMRLTPSIQRRERFHQCAKYRQRSVDTNLCPTSVPKLLQTVESYTPSVQASLLLTKALPFLLNTDIVYKYSVV